jgi:hypothetical protein
VRLWIDECLSPALVDLAQRRYGATCNKYRGLLRVEDEALYPVISQEEWVLVTNDDDFLALAMRAGLHPGLIILPQRTRPDQSPIAQPCSRDGYAHRSPNVANGEPSGISMPFLAAAMVAPNATKYMRPRQRVGSGPRPHRAAQLQGRHAAGDVDDQPRGRVPRRGRHDQRRRVAANYRLTPAQLRAQRTSHGEHQPTPPALLHASHERQLIDPKPRSPQRPRSMQQPPKV